MNSKTHTKERNLQGFESSYCIEIILPILLIIQRKIKIKIAGRVIPAQALSILESHNIVMCYVTFLHRKYIFCTSFMCMGILSNQSWGNSLKNSLIPEGNLSRTPRRGVKH